MESVRRIFERHMNTGRDASPSQVSPPPPAAFLLGFPCPFYTPQKHFESLAQKHNMVTLVRACTWNSQYEIQYTNSNRYICNFRLEIKTVTEKQGFQNLNLCGRM